MIREDIEHVVADGKVTLLSEGGSGHEPAHAGRMLTYSHVGEGGGHLVREDIKHVIAYI